MTTVRELIAQLSKVEDKDTLVVMSSDAEGNGFSPFCDISTGGYAADSTYSGDQTLGEDEPEEWNEDEDPDYTYTDYLKDVKAVPAVFIWPVN